ncbi:MAG: hypothetical protein QOE22_146 [Candidatus Parcubacteria bacterium]|jgi:lysophospholipase L1-like esterase|nr:hypothetical protein [Candidatus Parcubacteria bacterium]
MKTLLAILIGLVAIYLFYSGIRFLSLLNVSKKLIEQATPFTQDSTDTSRAMLVLGDSTAVGVGASTVAESVPGRVAAHVGATKVENYGVSGALVEDLPAQAKRAALPRYELILIQIGGNDMVRFHGAVESARLLGAVLEELPEAGTVVVISAADVGAARIFPHFIRPFYSALNKRYHAAFADAAREHGAIYVDLSEDPGSELFATDPATYFAPDSFHPSSAGYGLWFDAIRPSLPVR